MEFRAGKGIRDGLRKGRGVADFEDRLHGGGQITPVMGQHRRIRSDLQLPCRSLCIGPKVIVESPAPNLITSDAITPPLAVSAITVNGWLAPCWMLAEVGLIVNAVITKKIVAVAVPVTLWALAVILAVPVLTPVNVALPLPVTVATVMSELDQDTPLVTGPPLPSL